MRQHPATMGDSPGTLARRLVVAVMRDERMAETGPIMRQDPALHDAASNEMNRPFPLPSRIRRHNDMGSDGCLPVPRKIAWIVLHLVLAGCATPSPVPTPPDAPPAEEATVVVPTFTPGEFMIEAAYPHRIVKWSLPPDENGELTGSTRLPYWKLNAPGDERYLDQIGLGAKK